MATNLRLSREAADALRAAAVRSGRSQQELLREAVDSYLGRAPGDAPPHEAVVSGLVLPPTPFRDVVPTVRLRRGVTTAALLDRESGR
jgi:hypothetical protein